MARSGRLATLAAIGREIVVASRRDRVGGEAARVAYYSFLSLFPFLLVLFSVTGLIGGADAFRSIMSQVATALPGQAYQVVEDFVAELTRSRRPGVLSLSVALTFLLASNVFAALFDGLNMAYCVKRRRRWWKKRVMSVIFLMAALAALLGSAIALLAGPEIGRLIGFEGLASWLRWPLIYLVALGMLWLVYYFLPNHDQSRAKRRILVGAVVGTTLWAVVSVLFRVWVRLLSEYTPFGFVWGGMLLLVWLYLTALSILIGGQVAAALERRAVGL
ncbi:MAG: YihY/virulence factor BrkB family protein [Acidobacteriota bacterium]|nr:YihY/virulence factor BrkB family protein [Acidobacteriota bacterium]